MTGFLLIMLVLVFIPVIGISAVMIRHNRREKKYGVSYTEYWHRRRTHRRAGDLPSKAPTKPLAAGEVQ